LDPYVVFSPAVQWDPPIPANGRMDFIIDMMMSLRLD
jgi:hypothetical protein